MGLREIIPEAEQTRLLIVNSLLCRGRRKIAGAGVDGFAAVAEGHQTTCAIFGGHIERLEVNLKSDLRVLLHRFR